MVIYGSVGGGLWDLAKTQFGRVPRRWDQPLDNERWMRILPPNTKPKVLSRWFIAKEIGMKEIEWKEKWKFSSDTLNSCDLIRTRSKKANVIVLVIIFNDSFLFYPCRMGPNYVMLMACLLAGAALLQFPAEGKPQLRRRGKESFSPFLPWPVFLHNPHHRAVFRDDDDYDAPAEAPYSASSYQSLGIQPSRRSRRPPARSLGQPRPPQAALTTSNSLLIAQTR